MRNVLPRRIWPRTIFVYAGAATLSIATSVVISVMTGALAFNVTVIAATVMAVVVFMLTETLGDERLRQTTGHRADEGHPLRAAREDASALVERWATAAAASDFVPALAAGAGHMAALLYLTEKLASIYGVDLSREETVAVVTRAGALLYAKSVAGFIPLPGALRYALAVSRMRRAGESIMNEMEKRSLLPESGA